MNFEFLSETDLFRGIEPNDIKDMINSFNPKTKTYAKNEVIFAVSANESKIGIVMNGSVNMVVNHPWGTQSIFGRTERGGIIGGANAVFDKKPLICDTVAAENCEVMFFDMYTLLTIRKDSHKCHNKVIYNIMDIAAGKCLKFVTRMIHTSPKSLRERIMSYLAEQAMINGSNKFKVPFGRQQMADYLNVNRAAMCGELSKMQQERMIKFHKFDFEIFFGNKQSVSRRSRL